MTQEEIIDGDDTAGDEGKVQVGKRASKAKPSGGRTQPKKKKKIHLVKKGKNEMEEKQGETLEEKVVRLQAELASVNATREKVKIHNMSWIHRSDCIHVALCLSVVMVGVSGSQKSADVIHYELLTIIIVNPFPLFEEWQYRAWDQKD